jgi:phage shock protein A
VVRSEERVEQLTARALAIDELLVGEALAGPSPHDEVERELDAIDITGAVDADLAALRRELADEQATDGGAA